MVRAVEMDLPDGVNAAVWSALHAAHKQRAWVTITLHAPATLSEDTNVAPARTITGRVARIDQGPDGRPRVTLTLSAEVEQRLLVERIARVRLATLV